MSDSPRALQAQGFQLSIELGLGSRVPRLAYASGSKGTRSCPSPPTPAYLQPAAALLYGVPDASHWCVRSENPNSIPDSETLQKICGMILKCLHVEMFRTGAPASRAEDECRQKVHGLMLPNKGEADPACRQPPCQRTCNFLRTGCIVRIPWGKPT